MKTTFTNSFKLHTSTVLLVLLTFTSGCFSSSTGNGEGDGDSGIIDEDLELQNGTGRFKDGNIPGAAEKVSGLFQDIHFAYNASTVDPEYSEMLKESAKELSKDKTLKAEVEGHCDNRGTPEFNLALGEARARSAEKLLLSYGATRSQVSIISYGEEIPLDPSNNENAYAKNRRVHFALYRDGKKGN